MIRTKCILCKGSNWQALYEEKRLPKLKIKSEEVICTGELGTRGKHAKVWRCLDCGLIEQERSFTERELIGAYSQGEDERYFEQFSQRKELFERSLKRIEKYKRPPGRLLDVGAGAGLFVSVAKQSGWQAKGLEPSRWGVEKGKKRFGVKMEQGSFEDFKVKPESFEVITMWDVLEHYWEPMKVLRKARKMLTKDGVLVLTTININSWFSRLLGRHWTWLIRVHLWYFTNKTLRRMLEETGYQIEWMGTQTRWFSLPYLLSRFIGRDFSWFPEISLPAVTGDILMVVARRRQKLRKAGY